MISAMTTDKYIANKHIGLSGCFKLSLLGTVIFFIVNIGGGIIGTAS